MADQESAEPSGPGSLWSLGSIERLRSGLAATSRTRSLFPAVLAGLVDDQAWTGVARLVRDHTAAVLAAGEYPFEAFYAEDPTTVDLVTARVLDAVLEQLPTARPPVGQTAGSSGGLGPALPADLLGAPGLRPLVEDLIQHRLRVSSADRAGRRLARPTPGFDLVAWAWRIRMSPIGKEEDDLLAFSDHEVGYYVSRRQDAVVVEMTSRSRQRWLLGNLDSDLDALRFLVLRIGADWRSAMGRRLIGGAELRPGMALEDGPTATHLTWPGGWADFPKGLAGRSAALRFSRVVGLEPAQIVALYESRFGQLPTEPG